MTSLHNPTNECEGAAVEASIFQVMTTYGPLGLACLAEGWAIKILWTALREASNAASTQAASIATVVEKNTAALSGLTEIVKELRAAK